MGTSNQARLAVIYINTIGMERGIHADSFKAVENQVWSEQSHKSKHCAMCELPLYRDREVKVSAEI